MHDLHIHPSTHPSILHSIIHSYITLNSNLNVQPCTWMNYQDVMVHVECWSDLGLIIKRLMADTAFSWLWVWSVFMALWPYVMSHYEYEVNEVTVTLADVAHSGSDVTQGSHTRLSFEMVNITLIIVHGFSSVILTFHGCHGLILIRWYNILLWSGKEDSLMVIYDLLLH